MRSVTNGISRAQFIRGNFRGSKQVIRPPWAMAELDFVEACTRCGDCVGACPEKILETGRGGFPQVNFSKGECTFCGDCAGKCKSEALNKRVDDAPWSLKAVVAPSCLALKQVVCRTCGEACPIGAIRFRISVGAVSRPEVDPLACTGCGACYGPCPVSAITIGEMLAEVVA
ncbi:MAG: ferredoxin-type protein NapF [Gammaproteobacteria bacterium]|nr:ferredoxin-type protein NapF [Gammaproteobacteria bacterium]MBU1977763.1 ferredoxin-type protein NapF [Gammaproteobacteria bacterium]